MSTENGINPPAPNLTHNLNFPLLSILRKERRTGPNYMEYMQNLRFTLSSCVDCWSQCKKRKTSHSDWKRKATKGKFDRGSKRKAESEIAPTSDPKETMCFYCNTKGHWKRSCPKYLKDLKDGKVKKGSHSGLKESMRLKHGELNLVMGNRKITPVTRIGKYELMLKSGIRIDLNNCFGHVNKKCIAQLQKDGALESFDFKSDDYSKGIKMRLRTNMDKDKEDSGSKIDLEEIQKSANEEPIVNTDTQPEVVTHVKPDDIPLPIRRTSGRVSKPHQFYYGFHIKKDKSSDSTLTMKREIQSMYDNQVWNLVDTTPGLKTVRYKWIFKKKTYMDGKVHTYKARLVAKGYTQTHRIDYEETFSPVVKIKSIRIMLAVGAFHDYEIWQMDVKTAFLNEKLTEDMFMGAVTWKSSKHDTVTDSTCESKYIAACEASKEAIWMKNFIRDLRVVPTVQDLIEIFYDNKSAVYDCSIDISKDFIMALKKTHSVLAAMCSGLHIGHITTYMKIWKMDLEARSMQPNVKAMFLAKVREYKSDVKLNQAAQDKLLESGMADASTVSADQKARLLISTEKLNKTSDRVDDNRRTILESEELGVSILQDLNQQRHSLLHAMER
nr:vesicle transport v-SNARE 11-like [Tanacetum cinerariifolium]